MTINVRKALMIEILQSARNGFANTEELIKNVTHEDHLRQLNKELEQMNVVLGQLSEIVEGLDPYVYKYQLGEVLYPAGESEDNKKLSPFLVCRIKDVKQLSPGVDRKVLNIVTLYSNKSSELNEDWVSEDKLTRCPKDGSS